MRKNHIVILLPFIISLFLFASCKVAYKAAKANDATTTLNQTAQSDTIKATATMNSWFKNWSRDKKDTSFFQVGFDIAAAKKGEDIRIASVKIEVKDYPMDTNVYVLEKRGGVVRKRFHPPHTNYMLDTLVAGLKDGKNLDLADGNYFVFTDLFKRPGKRHFAHQMQVDVELNMVYNGQPVSASRVFIFNKRLSAANF